MPGVGRFARVDALYKFISRVLIIILHFLTSTTSSYNRNSLKSLFPIHGCRADQVLWGCPTTCKLVQETRNGRKYLPVLTAMHASRDSWPADLLAARLLLGRLAGTPVDDLDMAYLARMWGMACHHAVVQVHDFPFSSSRGRKAEPTLLPIALRRPLQPQYPLWHLLTSLRTRRRRS
jgi:hypothetical protein